MKRIVFIALMIISLALWSDLADSEIIVSGGEVNAGDSLEITVSTSEILEEWDVISFQFEMFYDPQVVSFSSYEYGDIFADNLLYVNELEPGILRAAYSDFMAESGSGIIIRMYFHGINGNTELDIHDFKFNATPIDNTTNGNISVIGGNQLPVAVAGEDITVNEGEVVQLDGSGSYDPEGNPITYLWSAPVAITFDDPTAETPQFTAPMVQEDTEYTITLVVNDGDHNSLPDEVIVTVENVSALDNIPSQINSVGIHSVSPNPFNPTTTINLMVPWNETALEVNIYSVKGQLVKSYQLTDLVSNSLKQIVWNGDNRAGHRVASGVYFCKVTGEHSGAQEKLLLLK